MMSNKIKKVLAILILTLIGTQYAEAQNQTIVVTLQKLKRGWGSKSCELTWMIENNSETNFVDLWIEYNPQDGGGFNLRTEQFNSRVTPKGKAKIEQTYGGGDCSEIKGIHIIGFHPFTKTDKGSYRPNDLFGLLHKKIDIVFDGKAVNVKEVK